MSGTHTGTCLFSWSSWHSPCAPPHPPAAPSPVPLTVSRAPHPGVSPALSPPHTGPWPHPMWRTEGTLHPPPEGAWRGLLSKFYWCGACVVLQSVGPEGRLLLSPQQLLSRGLL